ncbi:hypothetical protein MHYP_G00170160 [Metynnis hypsauchen]
MKYESVESGGAATLQCGEMSKGSVIWSRERDGRREDILTLVDGGGVIKHVNDIQKRYNFNRDDRSLMIIRVSSSDAGLYYWNSSAVCLTVTSGPTMTSQDKCDSRLEELNTRGFWIALPVVVGVVLLLALASLSTRKGLSERKEACEMPYDDVYTTIEYVAFNKA